MLPSGEERVTLEAGFLWQQVTRSNKKLGIEASVLNFVPVSGGTYEIMRVRFSNIGKGKISLTGISGVPLFGRSGQFAGPPSC